MWVVGRVTPEELAELRKRGWEDEDPPAFLAAAPTEDGDRTRMFFVDNDLFKVMSGPDWDKEHTVPETNRMQRPVQTFEDLWRIIDPAEPLPTWPASSRGAAMGVYQEPGATVETLFDFLGLHPREWSATELVEISDKLGIPI